ncbi:MAG: hypothetical protein J6R27_01640 [Muribaculaceae bacterium]|nr:hypothetical protein [Muribaculaceae bacterium]
MANKRILKKQIRYICGDVAAECIMSKIFIPGVNQEKFDDIVIKIAELQTTALARTNVAFDKAPRDFESGAAYRKARKQYFAKAFSALKVGFEEQLNAIVKEMNEAMPAKK